MYTGMFFLSGGYSLGTQWLLIVLGILFNVAFFGAAAYLLFKAYKKQIVFIGKKFKNKVQQKVILRRHRRTGASFVEKFSLDNHENEFFMDDFDFTFNPTMTNEEAYKVPELKSRTFKNISQFSVPSEDNLGDDQIDKALEKAQAYIPQKNNYSVLHNSGYSLSPILIRQQSDAMLMLQAQQSDDVLANSAHRYPEDISPMSPHQDDDLSPDYVDNGSKSPKDDSN